jgi:predicted site-specific integrase-resolvase
MDLLRITRTTLHEWRTQGRLQAVRAHPTAHWKYPADQPALAAALDAVRRPA